MPVKWTAPEILFGDASNLSTKSDVYVLVVKSHFTGFLCKTHFRILDCKFYNNGAP